MRVVTAAAFLAGAVVALGGAVGATWLMAPPPAQPEPTLSEADVRGIVQSYLTEKPDVVIDAIRAFQAREDKREAEQRNATIASMWDEISAVDGDPIVGNPQGDVTLVEFFDYRCGYCKRMAPEVNALIEEDPKVRIVMKEFPILGPESVVAARAALAADRQGRYRQLHDALMSHTGQLDTEAIYGIAESTGLDMERLRADMQHPDVDAILRRNMELADSLEIRGTPAFVTRTGITPGAVSRSTLRDMVAKARKSST